MISVSIYNWDWAEAHCFNRYECLCTLQMPIILPIIFSLISVFLIAVPICTSPVGEIGVAVLIVLSGIPVYVMFVMWKRKPKFIKTISGKTVTLTLIPN